MLSFKDYVNKNILLKESFSGLPDIEVYNLDKFIKKQNVKTEEIEEADDEAMLGAKHSIPSDSEIQDYLDRVMRGEKTTREKYVMPYVHNTLLRKFPAIQLSLMLMENMLWMLIRTKRLMLRH